MAREIERKFLVHGEAWRTAAEDSFLLRQGYLTDHRSGRASVRVRVAGDHGELNIKSLELGVSRDEFSYRIPVEEAGAMLDGLCRGPRIEKRRHHIRHGGHLWEVDEFFGDNQGLVVAEIELDDPEEAFERPDWLGPEVTHLERYFNVALVQRPFSQWSEAEREARDVD
ncbi:CYTH domain-containing protein [Gammaproteobacteria bacterium AB-CW1]|uniref:CYTH domain-containing protein n=1 Tax=Natronospira elongata TaxID=3110268 RepID=A0AAP6MN60_9GAMM|nr:CYTH domain-containing protein [Gammaproteobacteria bacterium AB-CW1]